jgi:hypothetical protein
MGKICFSVMGYMRKLELALGSALLLFATFATGEEYYTWVDENGVTNYSERNPQGYDASHVTPQGRFGYRYQPPAANANSDTPATPAAEDTQTTASDSEDLSDAEIEQQIASERARIDAEIAKAKSSNCKIGRRNLAQLEAYARIRVKDDDGQERVLTDAEKADRIGTARKTIRENCTG